MLQARWPRIVIFASVIGVVLAGSLVAAWRLSSSRTTQVFGELITSVPGADSMVALTFDDGPVRSHTDSVLAVLRRENVRATFFVTGSSVVANPELARRILEDGHELGNHSYSHRQMVLMSPRRVREEVESTDSLIRALGVTGPIHFRPPYGKRLIVLPWYLSRSQRPTVLWSLEPDSWFSEHAEMVRHVSRNVQPGSIILLHVEISSRSEERAALPLMIQDLKQRGYRFATVSELLGNVRTTK